MPSRKSAHRASAGCDDVATPCGHCQSPAHAGRRLRRRTPVGARRSARRHGRQGAHRAHADRSGARSRMSCSPRAMPAARRPASRVGRAGGGLADRGPGYQLDRRCGCGLQAVIDAAMMVQTGAADVVVAGGVESMSNAEYYITDMRGGARAGSVTLHDRLARGAGDEPADQPLRRDLRHDRDRRQPGARLPDHAARPATSTPR